MEISSSKINTTIQKKYLYLRFFAISINLRNSKNQNCKFGFIHIENDSITIIEFNAK